MQIEIINWTKFNGKETEKTPNWFKVHVGIGASKSLFKLPVLAKWTWVCLLSEAKKAKSHKFNLDLVWACHHWDIKEKDLLEAIEKLNEKGMLRFNSEFTPSELRDNSALERERERELERDIEREGFDKFWVKYPRKIEKNTAKETYQKVIKTPKQREDVSIAADKYSQYCKVNNKESEFILHPSTFLNKKKWEGWVNPDVPLDMAEDDARRFGFLRKTQGEANGSR